MLLLRKLLLAFLFAGLCSSSLEADVLTGVDPTIINVGTGLDIAYLVIDESTLYSTPLEFVYHYTYNSANTLTLYDLLEYIASDSSSGLSISTTYYTNWNAHFLDSITYDGTTVSGTNAADGSSIYWSLYVSGVLDDGNTTATNEWSSANSGMDSITILTNSWSGWTLGSYAGGTETSTAPSVLIAAVPEPETVPFLLLSVMTLFFLLRWRSSDRKSTS